MTTKYTEEKIKKAVQNSISIAETMRNLGISYISGGMHSYLSRRIKKLKIDTGHFLGKAANQGDKHKGGPDKKHWKEILIIRKSDRREASFRLRRAMLESGIAYKCRKCNLDDTWQNETIRLQINHIDGKPLDNRKKNLEFLCPNRHSQTKGWSQSKGNTKLTARKKKSKRKP